MSKYPQALTRFSSNLIYVFAIPTFFLVSVLLYEPSRLVNLMNTGEGVSGTPFYFNISIVTAIILVVMLLSRLLLFLLRKHMDMNLGWFAVWCLMETVAIAAFVALYLSLMDKGGDSFFLYLGRSISILSAIFIYPYVILTLAFALSHARNAASSEPETRLKFYDSRHQLKFITSAESLLYLESNENYVIIHFNENGIEKKYQLRNTLKSVEPLCEKAGFVRTHRGFIVNPAHVRLIRKEPGGFFFADIGSDRPQGIPVSKKYYDNITAAL